MAMTDREALDAQATRGLGVRKTKAGWIALTPEGPRVRVSPAATPEAAIEAADVHLREREAANLERRARTLMQAMQRGEHYHQPREIEEDDGAGGTTTVVVFDVLTRGGEPTEITGRRSVIEAWRDLRASLEGE